MLDKRYSPKDVEQGKYENWKNKGYFTAGDKTKSPYSMVIPPPNVTGKLHLGHAWNTTIQDIIARYKKMQGFDVLWLPGMDHAGIATQAKVMGKLSQTMDVTKISREDFLHYAWAWKDEYANNIHQQWAKMGIAIDYTRERFTLDEGLNRAVNKVFVDLYNKGLIYQGERIISWDPVQQTALSNIEVIHQDDEGFMYYFRYPIVGTNEYLEVATTRPETMFGDMCVCVNPNDERYKKYHGMKVINPANGQIIPIIADEYVDVEFGTGAMKCTPAHDPNDFIIGKKYGLEMPIIFNKDATMNNKCGEYEGLDRFVCREKLIENITKDGNFIKKEKLIHAVGHSQRNNCVVEPMLSKQWFVKMKPLAEQAIKNQEGSNKVTFVPERFEHTFLQWMNNIEDWCISRQLWWGHRIPAYTNKITGEILVSEFPPKDIENYDQDPDVLDTWFSSGLWPFSTLGWPDNTDDLNRYFPTTTLVTAYDIIFFWVSRMIFQSLNITNQRPFENVVIHGLVRDELGRKMSKSLGNGVDPIDVIDKFGVDALRYFLTTNSTPGQDMRYSEEKVESSANYLNKIWNSARYVLSVIPEGVKEQSIDINQLSNIDKWILNRLQTTIKNVTTNMEKFDFNAASSHLYNFVYDDFCSQYLEMSKVALNSNDEAKKNTTYQVLLKCLKNIILLIYPYTPFIAEELYQNLPSHLESVMLETYPVVEECFICSTQENEINTLFNLIKEVRNYKIVNKLAPNAKLDISLKLKLEVSDDFKIYLDRFTFANVNIASNLPDGDLFSFDYADLVISSSINKEEVIAKLKSDIAKEENEIARGSGMLSNPNFINKAPKEKVELEKQKLEQHKLNLKSLQDKLDKIIK